MATPLYGLNMDVLGIYLDVSGLERSGIRPKSKIITHLQVWQQPEPTTLHLWQHYTCNFKTNYIIIVNVLRRLRVRQLADALC